MLGEEIISCRGPGVCPQARAANKASPPGGSYAGPVPRAAVAAAVGAGFLPGKCSFCFVVDKATNHILTYKGEG